MGGLVAALGVAAFVVYEQWRFRAYETTAPGEDRARR
jgi:hypothetical protein